MAFTFDTKAELYFNQSIDPLVTAYTCGAGTKLLILGIVMGTTTPRAGGTPTYDGVAMTQISSVQVGSSKLNTEMWYLVNPTTGSAKNFSIPKTGTRYGRLFISSYKSDTTPILDVVNQSNTDAQNPSLAVVTTGNGEVIIDVIGQGDATVEIGHNQTLLYEDDDGIYNSAAQYALQTNAGSITFTHNCNSSAAVGFIVAAFKIPPVQKTILSDTHIKATGVQKTILSDTHIKATGVQKTITSDTEIIPSKQKTILSDTHIKATGVQKTITSDARISIQYQKTILSDAHIKATGILKTILSDAKIVIQVLYDINNKISTVKQVLSNINNKFSLAKRVLSDVTCFISTVKAKIYDINNKVNTQARKLYDVNNDVRFIKSWQKAGTFGFQSLGKSYIKVFIATVEQTDVDVDSINIRKQLNSAHTASFNLGRTYDNATIPALESIIEIRYYRSAVVTDYWLLFKGYVTKISPSDTPESITIDCQGKYWKDNQTNKYFFVGHNPHDNREKYYDTIKIALLTELGWDLSIGDFVPEIIDCFGQGQSDIITSLLEQCGNFGWWYDVDGTRKLWEGGLGSQVNIQRQTIGENIKLYDLIDHKITSSAENVINKYRVQMGQKVGRTDKGGRTWTAYACSNFEGKAIPAWDRSLENLAKKGSATGYGFNYTGITNENLYKDVFRKYSIPDLDPDTSSWSDRYPPKIEILSPMGYYGFAIGEITEGYTIDYENRTITFNEPQFIYTLDNYGNMHTIRAPIIRVSLWKENYFTYTNADTDNPESTISNPYMFFRDSTGFIPTPTYPITVIKLLNLTGLTHQEGFGWYDPHGVLHVVRTFDDTNYAKDFIDWQLSNTCDEKILGTFTLTLDALCFNNIDLSKRLYIEGITDTPLNIVSIDYNLSNFTVSIEVENKRYYKRTVSIPRHD